MRRVTALLALACVTCGDGGDSPDGIPPLIADPAVVTACAPGPVAAGAVRAKPVACAEELVPGRLAAGRVGDLLLENARVRAIVRGPGQGYYMYGLAGGGLIDVARAGGEDLLKEIQPTLDLNVGQYDELVIVEAGDDGPAEIVVRGPAALLPLLDAVIGGQPIEAIIEQHYRLAPDSDAIELTTVLRAAPGAAPAATSYTLIDGLFFGGRVRPFIPGKGYTEDGTNNGQFIVSDGTTTSYALVYPPGGAAAVQLLDVKGVRLAFGPEVRFGDDEAVTRWLIVGDGSAASLTERAWELRGVATGAVSGTTAPGVEVVVADGDGDPVTIARADAAGAYGVRLPAGDYTLHAEGPGRAPGAGVAVTVTAGGAHTADVVAAPAGAVQVSVRDPDGNPLPARVKLEAADRQIAFVGASGDATIPVVPGSYRLSISRGMEYDAWTADPLVVGEGETVPVSATLTRVIDTDGWIALDTHLHSEMSTDSVIPLEDRVLAIAAEGVELPISTDHDFVTDYAPVIADLGLEAWVASVIGEEASSVVWGHLNAWPLVADRDLAAQGAVPWYGRSPGEVFDLLRGNDPTRIVQVNHPRTGSTSGLFDAIGLDPPTLTAQTDPEDLGLPGADLNDFDFDAVEVANGLGLEDFEEGFRDWLALVGAGHRVAATGCSDSHGATTYAGESRTYVWVGPGNDTPAAVMVQDVNESIRARRVIVAQGSFVVAGIVGTDGAVSLPGDLVSLPGAAQATVRITVQAPPWMPLQKIRVYERDAVIAESALDPASTAAIRFDGELTLPLGAEDTFFVVRVDAAGSGDPVLGTPAGSITNPLLVDVDGDGMFTP